MLEFHNAFGRRIPKRCNQLDKRCSTLGFIQAGGGARSQSSLERVVIKPKRPGGLVHSVLSGKFYRRRPQGIRYRRTALASLAPTLQALANLVEGSRNRDSLCGSHQLPSCLSELQPMISKQVGLSHSGLPEKHGTSNPPPQWRRPVLSEIEGTKVGVICA